MNETVLLEVHEGTATVTLNRPSQSNAVSFAMMKDLHRVACRLRDDRQFAVVVITGAGEHFVAGDDLGDFSAHFDLKPQARQIMFRALIEKHVNPTIEILHGLQQPVVAKVRGECAGFGLSLLLASDLAVTADNAVFSAPHASIALSPDGGMSYFLPRIAGFRKAAELMLLGERLDAEAALRLGLVNSVVAPADLDTETDALVARLKRGPRNVHAEIKRLLSTSLDLTLEAQLESEALAFGRCVAATQFVEYINAICQRDRSGTDES